MIDHNIMLEMPSIMQKQPSKQCKRICLIRLESTVRYCSLKDANLHPINKDQKRKAKRHMLVVEHAMFTEWSCKLVSTVNTNSEITGNPQGLASKTYCICQISILKSHYHSRYGRGNRICRFQMYGVEVLAQMYVIWVKD